MDKIEVKKTILKIITSSQELKNCYDILLKDKVGYMTNMIHDYLKLKNDEFLTESAKYYITNSDKNTKEMYKNIVNSMVKGKLEKTLGKKIPSDFFREIMNEMIDDLVAQQEKAKEKRHGQ